MSDIRIQQMRPGDWERVRSVRLRALADSPDAFGATLEEERSLSQNEWMERLGRSDAATFVASDSTRDIGLIVGAPYGDCAGLYAMWVAPEVRGRGIGGRLVDSVIAWASAKGHERILLDVGDDNTAALALYQSRGFVPTDVVGSLPPPRDAISERQMELILS